MWVRIGCGCVWVRRGVEPPCVGGNRVWLRVGEKRGGASMCG